MQMAGRIDGPRRPPANGSPPAKLVVLLHGFGADGNDLIGLAPYLARALPDALFVSPHAPEPCEMSAAGRQWFAIRSFGMAERTAGARRAAPVLDRFLDEEMQRYGLGEKDTALVGFSQGTMMALQVGVRRARPLAAIVGFSGALAGAETLAGEVRSHPPILLVHGDMDEVLPLETLFEATDGLCRAGLWARWHISQGLGHSIGEDGMELATRFLADGLAGRMQPLPAA